jgi:HEAT repeat protein
MKNIVRFCLIAAIFAGAALLAAGCATFKDRAYSKDEAERLSGVFEFGRLSQPDKIRYIPDLLNDIEDEDEIKRKTASGLLRMIGEPAVEGLIAKTKSERSITRYTAYEALRDMNFVDKRITSVFLNGLKEQSKSTSTLCRDYLVQIGSSDVSAVLKSLKDENLYLKINIAFIIGKINPVLIEAVPDMIENLKYPVLLLNSHTVDSLVSMALSENKVIDYLTAGLNTDNENIKHSLIFTLGKIGGAAERAVPYVLNVIKNGNNQIKINCFRTLVNIAPNDPNVAAVLTEAALDKDLEISSSAVESLGFVRVDTQKALKSLIEKLDSEIYLIRKIAEKSLERLAAIDVKKDQAGIEIYTENSKNEWAKRRFEVITGLQSSINSGGKHSKSHIIKVLGELRDNSQKTLKIVIECCSDKNVKVRVAAIEFFSNRVFIKESVPYLVAAFEDQEKAVVDSAASVYDSIGSAGQDVLKKLLPVLASKKEYAKEKAKKVFYRLGNISKTTLISGLKDNNKDVRSACLEILGKIGKTDKFIQSDLPAIIETVKDPELEVRIATVKALGEIQECNNEIISVLIEVLQSEEKSMRLESIIAIGKIGAVNENIKSVVPFLVELLKDSDGNIKLESKKALLRVGHTNIEAVIQGLRTQDTFVRTSVTEVLEKLGVSRGLQAIRDYSR